MTPGLLKVDRAAGSFVGLPEGVESPGQRLAAPEGGGGTAWHFAADRARR